MYSVQHIEPYLVPSTSRTPSTPSINNPALPSGILKPILNKISNLKKTNFKKNYFGYPRGLKGSLKKISQFGPAVWAAIANIIHIYT